MNSELQQNSLVKTLVAATAAIIALITISTSLLLQPEQPGPTSLTVEPKAVPTPQKDPNPVATIGAPAPEMVVEVAQKLGQKPVAVQAPEPVANSLATPAPAQFEEPAGSGGSPIMLPVIIIWLLVVAAAAVMIVAGWRQQSGSRSERSASPVYAS